MLRTLSDFYSMVGSIKKELEVQGESDLAQRLSAALSGTTSGEILELVWSSLKDVPTTFEMARQVKEAQDFIVQNLGPPRK